MRFVMNGALGSGECESSAGGRFQNVDAATRDDASRPREALTALAVAEELIREGEIVYVPLLRRAEAGAWQQLRKPQKARACLIAARDAATAMGAGLLHRQAEEQLTALGPSRPVAARRRTSPARVSTSQK